MTRVLYCDPFGHNTVDNLHNYGEDVVEYNFVYCHDQEPLYPDIHADLFLEVDCRNRNLNHDLGPRHAAIITSEADSDIVTQVCSQYQWQSYYYFFHGWAALDWYRGYDRTFLIEPAERRAPNKVFFNANRIIDGRRDHRILMMYHLVRNQCHNGYSSFPRQCPDSQRDVLDIVQKFSKDFPDIVDTFASLDLPMNLPGETGHPMHSCWLSQFDAVADSLVYIVTETLAQGRRWHLTEKTFRPICMQSAFVLVGTCGSLEYLRRYGFRTFHDYWDESYDTELDDMVRIQKIGELIKDLHSMPIAQRQRLHRAMLPVIQHNFQHFYSGEFERILWQELTDMLDQIKKDFDA